MKVQLVSVDKRYNDTVYPSVPVLDTSINTYLTGQHIDPKDPTTFGNLTRDEMTGKVAVPAEKLAKFPYIIYPETLENGKVRTNTIPLRHGDTLDLSKSEDGKYINSRDGAIYEYWKHQANIAFGKDQINKGVTFFYVLDKEAEASKRVSLEDQIFEAQSLIRSTNIGKYKDLALLLNHKIKNFNINVDVLTEVQIKDKLIEACKTNPTMVVSCFDKAIELDLFILKLVKNGIIVNRTGSYYDGNMFLGLSIEEVKSFASASKNQEYVTKWGRLLIK